MKMRRLGTSGGDFVNVDVVNGIAQRANIFYSRLFAGLAKRNPKHVGIAVGVASKLHPFIQSMVLRQKDFFALQVHNPCRTRNMPRLVRTLEAILVPDDEPAQIIEHLPLRNIERLILVQPLQKPVSFHREHSGNIEYHHSVRLFVGDHNSAIVRGDLDIHGAFVHGEVFGIDSLQVRGHYRDGA